MLEVSARTHAGAVRPMNEDCVLADPHLSLIAVADGMGGHNAGEVASSLALDTLHRFIQKSAANMDHTWPFGVTPTLSLDVNRLRTATLLANQRIHREAEERVEYSGMGTTVVAALFRGAEMTFVNVGDSRLYIFDANGLRQVSEDDSWAAMLVRDVGLKPEEAAHHPMRNILTRVVGAKPELEPTVTTVDITPGQIVMLCSDGLHTSLSDAAIETLLRMSTDLNQIADALIQAALATHCADNVSVVLARLTAD